MCEETEAACAEAEAECATYKAALARLAAEDARPLPPEVRLARAAESCEHGAEA